MKPEEFDAILSPRLRRAQHTADTKGTPLYMLAVPKGWYDIVVALDAELAEKYPQYVLFQAKSKFGSLRYYIDIEGVPYKEYAPIVEAAELKSQSTCEVCGAPGRLYVERGWYNTCCAIHGQGEIAVD